MSMGAAPTMRGSNRFAKKPASRSFATPLRRSVRVSAVACSAHSYCAVAFPFPPTRRSPRARAAWSSPTMTRCTVACENSRIRVAVLAAVAATTIIPYLASISNSPIYRPRWRCRSSTRSRCGLKRRAAATGSTPSALPISPVSFCRRYRSRAKCGSGPTSCWKTARGLAPRAMPPKSAIALSGTRCIGKSLIAATTGSFPTASIFHVAVSGLRLVSISPKPISTASAQSSFRRCAVNVAERRGIADHFFAWPLLQRLGRRAGINRPRFGAFRHQRAGADHRTFGQGDAWHDHGVGSDIGKIFQNDRRKFHGVLIIFRQRRRPDQALALEPVAAADDATAGREIGEVAHFEKGAWAADNPYIGSNMNIVFDFGGGCDIGPVVDGNVTANTDELGSADRNIRPNNDIGPDPGECDVLIRRHKRGPVDSSKLGSS